MKQKTRLEDTESYRCWRSQNRSYNFRKWKVKGEIETLDMVTYRSVPRSGGAYYAEGKGVFMTKDGSGETAAWTWQGIAHYSGLKRRDVGSVFCRTSSSSSTTGKLAFIKNLVGEFEYEV